MNLVLWDKPFSQSEIVPEPLDELGQLGFDFMYKDPNPSFPPPQFKVSEPISGLLC